MQRGRQTVSLKLERSARACSHAAPALRSSRRSELAEPTQNSAKSINCNWFLPESWLVGRASDGEGQVADGDLADADRSCSQARRPLSTTEMQLKPRNELAQGGGASTRSRQKHAKLSRPAELARTRRLTAEQSQCLLKIHPAISIRYLLELKSKFSQLQAHGCFASAPIRDNAPAGEVREATPARLPPLSSRSRLAFLTVPALHHSFEDKKNIVQA